MKQLFFFMLIAGLIWACGETSTEKTNGTENTTAQTEVKEGPDGEKIYKQYCITCHGLYGDMGASGAFNLTTSALSLDERVLVITNGRNVMTPFKDLLSEEKIKAVAEYTLKLKK
ncbi:MAG: hypothetical protein DHS20C18_55070 [Saprospiraceae bacterium]|nr:MAG: hypothetical protein DHS20C18_55070 [Saprospiraceae bacterium]